MRVHYCKPGLFMLKFMNLTHPFTECMICQNNARRQCFSEAVHWIYLFLLSDVRYRLSGSQHLLTASAFIMTGLGDNVLLLTVNLTLCQRKRKKKITCLVKISKSVETIDSLNIHFQRNSVLPSQVLQVNLSQFWQIFLLQQPAYLHNIEEQLHGLQHSRWFFGSFYVCDPWRQHLLANPSNSSPAGSYHCLNFDGCRDKAR